MKRRNLKTFAFIFIFIFSPVEVADEDIGSPEYPSESPDAVESFSFVEGSDYFFEEDLGVDRKSLLEFNNK